jgi:hypothetical protein
MRKFFGSQFVTHLTDVEGNWGYFRRWIDRSRVIGLKDNHLYFRKPNAKFVFGGDAVDKGDGDIRITELLVNFKKQYPDQVILLVGNRENKYPRFISELHPLHIRERLLGDSVWWAPESPPKIVLEKAMGKKGDYEAYLKSLSDAECQLLMLKWMLSYNMGCGALGEKPDTFELRRSELAQIHPHKSDISDLDVLESFVKMIAPNGAMREYLQLSDVAHIHRDTLFIHGAITTENLGWVPCGQGQYEKIHDLDSWVNKLNAWYRHEIIGWIDNPIPKTVTPPGSKAIDYYTIHNPRNVITSNWYTDNQIAKLSSQVTEYLNQSGVRRVVSGHQPFGDYPLILREFSSKNCLEVIAADTSYSDIKHPHDNRGIAIHNLDIEFSGRKSTVTLDILRKEGKVIKLTLDDPSKPVKGQEKLGLVIDDHWVVGPKQKGLYHCRKLAGHDVKEKFVNDQLEMINADSHKSVSKKI